MRLRRFAYDSSLRALASQEAQLAALHTRASFVLSAAGIATGAVLGGNSANLSGAAIAAVVLFAIAAILSTAVLVPRPVPLPRVLPRRLHRPDPWRFTANAAMLVDTVASRPDMTTTDVREWLGKAGQENYISNRGRLKVLYRLFTLACVALAAAIVVSIAGLAVVHSGDDRRDPGCRAGAAAARPGERQHCGRPVTGAFGGSPQSGESRDSWRRRQRPRNEDRPVASSDHWVKWAAIAGIGAAIATFVLSVVTFLLVRATKSIVAGGEEQIRATKNLAAATLDQSTATKDQATTAARALQLQTEPHIVPVHDVEPKMVWRDGASETGPATLELQIQNAGNGVAQITKVEVRCGDLGPPVSPETVARVLVAGAVATIRADFAMLRRSGWTGPPKMPASAMARVDYRGRDGREFTTHFGWMLREGIRWEVILNESRELT
jgi:hypothetical protein